MATIESNCATQESLTASRMESTGVIDSIQVSAEFYRQVEDEFVFERRGKVDVKGKGEFETYLLIGRI